MFAINRLTPLIFSATVKTLSKTGFSYGQEVWEFVFVCLLIKQTNGKKYIYLVVKPH